MGTDSHPIVQQSAKAIVR